MDRRALLAGFTLLWAAQDVGAVSFGTFDPRSMAMGGAGVASATSANASFYNPALLAAARDGDDFSFELPVIGVRLSDPDDLIGHLDDYQQAHYEAALSNAIDQYNASPTPAARAAVVTAAGKLVTGLSALDHRALQADANVGMVIGIPSRRWGAALFLNSRAVGGAMLDVTQADLDRLNALIGGLQNNDLTGLTDGSGNVIDPAANLSSAVLTRGALLSEVGVSLAREFSAGGHSLAVGITPKFIKVETFDYRVDVETADLTVDQGRKSYSNANLDLGIAHEYGNHWKTGIVVKDLVAKNYTTALGRTIALKPQVRWGLAYTGSVVVTALDVDLTQNAGTGLESASQYIALGAELNAWDLFQLRLGLRHNLSDSDTDSAAFGFGLSPFGVHLDLAVVGSAKEVGVGLQAGFRF